MRTTITAALVFFSLLGSAEASTLTAVGAVKALNATNQVLGLVGTANFDEGPTSGNVPLNQYTPQGLTFATGNLTSILAGVTTPGSAANPIYTPPSAGQFPIPIGGGGTQVAQIDLFGGVGTFSGANITQVGLTACNNGDQYLTVWSKTGAMIGQVNWQPTGPVQFIGIDTLGVPIGMVAYGNDDLWAGGTYDISGATIFADTWMWATGKCSADAQCDDQNPCTTDSCTIATGACVHTNNALSCSDGDACTQNDVCSAGACVPGTPVVCTALDGCHSVGVCNPMSGVCSTPQKPDGSACTDANACTQTDTCQAGVCTGQNPVLCPPPDACHTAGKCNVMTGMCTNPAKPNGTACSDNNACTQMNSCQAGTCTGMNPVACPAVDDCHDPGVCDTVTGACSALPKSDGSSCDDGQPCTQGDSCVSGVCSGTPVVCKALDACHLPGTCGPTGECSNPPALDCTAKSFCEQDGFCDTATVTCFNAAKPDGVPCGKGVCVAGSCTDEAGNTTSSATSSGATTGAGGAMSTGATSGTGAGGAGAGGAGAGGANSVTGVGGASTGPGGPGATASSGGDGSVTPSGGCGCSIPEPSSPRAPWLLLGLLLPVWRRRRRAQAHAA